MSRPVAETDAALPVQPPPVEAEPVQPPPVEAEPVDVRDAPGHRRRNRAGTSVVRGAMVRFAAGTLAILAVLLGAAVWISSHIAREETLRDSRERSQALAKFVVAPAMSSGVAPNAADRAALDEQLGTRIEDGSIVRAKIWSRDGTVLWSDEKSIVGQRFALDEEERELFGTHRAKAELSTLLRAENVAERGLGPLIEVYAGATARDGEPIVFEAYFPVAQIDRDSRTLGVALAGLSVAVLVLFAAASWPLALSLARRVERVTERNARLVGHSLRASDLERRRMSENLHDDVIPDLAGVGYLLPVIDQHVAKGDQDTARRYLDRVGEIVHRDVASLRAALVDIHPPDLVRDGLQSALIELADETRRRGRTVNLQLPDSEPPVHVAQLVYRVVREGLRNVSKHSDADQVLVRVITVPSRLNVVVEDNGVGPSATTSGSDHMGLQLLEETVHDLGGLVVLEHSALGGARLRVEVPLPLVAG